MYFTTSCNSGMEILLEKILDDDILGQDPVRCYIVVDKICLQVQNF